MALQAIKYSRGTLSILDQLLLPHQSIYISVPDVTTAWNAIKTMQVRGAPAIAIVAVLSLAVELHNNPPSSNPKEEIHQKLDYLVTSRPTAVNLADASNKLKSLTNSVANESPEVVVKSFIEAAEQMLTQDVEDNKAIGHHGAQWIQNAVGKTSDIKVLTHCNTGSLATASYGTALGIIRSLHSDASLSHAYCTETRPYNQGSRLTAYELVHEKIPSTLITDSMAASLLSHQQISAIIVGADRVAANGDTANKIGTFQLAIIAKHFGVKFVVAAPTTSVDLETKSGEGIKIEQRPGWEVLVVSGPTVVNVPGKDDGTVKVNVEDVRSVKQAADGIGVFNPSFDVTPAALIDAIVTENGVVEKNADGVFPMHEAFK
ncbi:S-methyl-5-thioribose-1-phosphate isomerase [Orbilia oligospora]|uniref:Methylthioribose-1-phosphate isomerase n=1 Tax=Orbilia oligospora TaxID=2813651 RepID=A0A7C8JZT3_ORBOL|nr:S-methyl-5-thioribose-1-phosphate isomerase [Orbilia oligospora]KAF3103085.1 S-methyl-5-thioribose-1-phosphate isomerase [Orbilia oligospora]KAF3138606.1 S-methyl-5-thioribose-1-phosphate isomerase [Orbilia oligospora]KAF3142438.1 S-methyl-5-thioribose-1-phosphate isomerase [Orbilia oligospora]KAF3149334.1 S-methyl-5-thioribose-1-phosphate isomerase [Orbilia oligospora]